MKRTKVENFEAIREYVQDNAEYVAFLDAEIARLKNRAARVGEKRAEKNGAKATEYTTWIIDVLRDAGRPITLAELVGGIEVEGVTPGKVAYYAGKLVDTGAVLRDKIKVDGRKVTTYEIAE